MLLVLSLGFFSFFFFFFRFLRFTADCSLLILPPINEALYTRENVCAEVGLGGDSEFTLTVWRRMPAVLGLAAQ